MSRRRSLSGLLTVALAVLGLSIASPLAPTAQAVTGSPPVTAPDAVTVLQANLVAVHPVNNDHDPDNDLLALCRLGTEHYKGLSVDSFGDELDIFAKPHAKPGTYTFTYYACDFSYLVAGTVSVTVEKLPNIKVKKIDGRPGVLRVTNPTDLAMRFLFGSFTEDQPDGSVLVKKGDSVVIHVHRTRIDWIATSRRGDIFLGTGHVTGIKLRGGATHHVSETTVTGRLGVAWRAA